MSDSTAGNNHIFVSATGSYFVVPMVHGTLRNKKVFFEAPSWTFIGAVIVLPWSSAAAASLVVYEDEGAATLSRWREATCIQILQG